MSTYIKIATNEYPLTDWNIRKDYPSTSFPTEIPVDVALSLGYAVVEPTAQPVGDVITEGEPLLIDGKYKQNWTVREHNTQEKDQLLNTQRESSLHNGVEYTFPNGVVDHIQINDRDMIILTSIEVRARANMDTPGYIQRFRSKSNQNYFLTAQEVIDMTTHVFDNLQTVYAQSWDIKDNQ